MTGALLARSPCVPWIACAVALGCAVAGCAAGGTRTVDAAHDRPPRTDGGLADDAGNIGARDVGATDGAALTDAGATDSGTSIDSGGVHDSGAAIDAAGARCCASAADCGALEVCVVITPGAPGVCERSLVGDRECWTDSDCSAGQRCGGARILACTEPRGIFGADSTGRCR